MSFEGKTILFVGGGRQALPAVELAKSLGAHIVVSDYDNNCPCFKIADHSIVASTYDSEATVAKAQEFHQNVQPIDGVLCVATDVPFTVAAVAHALNLPSIPLASAKLANNKLAMKELFAEHGVPIPAFQLIESASQLNKIRSQNPDSIYVIKPVDSRGSRGVLLLTKNIDSEWAYNTALAESPTEQVMLEEYLTGPQISSESVVVNGKVYTPALSNRNYELLEKYAPYFIENGGELPASQPDSIVKQIDKTLQQAAEAMSFKNGIIKGDLVIHQGNVKIIELALRLSGGYFCTHEIPLSSGANTVLANLYLCLDMTPPANTYQASHRKHVAQRYLFVPPGVISEISGIEAFNSADGVEFTDIWCQLGDNVQSPTNSGCSVAMVMTVGDCHQDAIDKAEYALSLLKITTS